MTKLNNIIFIFFITFSILNLYSHDLIQSIGKYGKTIIIPFIIYYFFYNIYNYKIIIKFNNIIYILFLFFIIGSINYIFYNNDYDGLIYVLIFISYIIYFYFFIYQLKISYPDNYFDILFNILKKTYIANFLFGFLFGFLTDISFWVVNKDTLAFGGFLGTSLLFGWLSLSFYFSVFFSKNKNTIDYLLLIISIIFVYISAARGAELTLLLFILFTIYLKLTFYYFNQYFTIVLKVMIIFVFTIIIYYLFYQISSYELNKLLTGRLFIWNITINNIFYNDIIYFGYGLNGYQEYLLDKYINTVYYFQDLKQSNGNLSLHSSYLTILTTGGLLSLITFFYIIYKVLYNTKDYLIIALLLSILIGGIIEQFIMSPNIPISILFWIIIIIKLEREH